MNRKPDFSIVSWYTDLEHHKCGYCKSANWQSVSNGMWADSLTVEDYQNLIDRGWRRSGHYCYKPVMNRTCCPAYTIRCGASELVLSKSQKKVIKKFNKFVNEGGELDKAGCANDEAVPSQEVLPGERKGGGGFDAEAFAEAVMNEERATCSGEEPLPALDPPTTDPTENVNQAVIGQSDTNLDRNKEAAGTSRPKGGIGADPNRPVCKKAKVLRLERKQQKLLKRGMSLEAIDKAGKEQKSLEDFLGEISENSKHKFRVTLERLHEEHKYFKSTADLYRKYQTVIHNDTVDKCNPRQYAMFLLASPLKYVPFPNNQSGSVLGYGSFHQLYWLDDKLIAVGVVDILPKCVSGVYFFYDPDYRSLTLGTYGTLRELELTRSLSAIQPSIQHYYMGFYIHSCPKMRYKGKLTPSFLLCPETYRWCPLQDSTAKLDASKYSRLDPDPEAKDEEACAPEDVLEVRMFVQKKIMPYKLYRTLCVKDHCLKAFADLTRLVGKKCYKKLIVAHVN